MRMELKFGYHTIRGIYNREKDKVELSIEEIKQKIPLNLRIKFYKMFNKTSKKLHKWLTENQVKISLEEVKHIHKIQYWNFEQSLIA